jgi:hypothetical protein
MRTHLSSVCAPESFYFSFSLLLPLYFFVFSVLFEAWKKLNSPHGRNCSGFFDNNELKARFVEVLAVSNVSWFSSRAVVTSLS